MPLDSAPKSVRPEPPENSWAEFRSGFSDRAEAPFRGVKQVLSEGVSSFFMKDAVASSGDDLVKTAAVHSTAAQKIDEPQSKARLAGEMVGAATLFMATTAMMKRVPSLKELAPTAAGAALGFLEPVLPGQSAMARLTRGAEGAFSVATLQYGPKGLVKAGILHSEKAVGGALISGALVGAVSEQARSFVQTGHMADAEHTALASISFGLTSGLLHGTGRAFSRGASAVGERSLAADTQSMKVIPSSASERDLASHPWHVILGSGGTKAALTGTGVVVALRQAGLQIETIGGVSGGTMPAAFAASDMSSHEMLKVASEIDIKSLVARKPWIRQLFSERSGETALRQGIYDTTRLGEMTNKHVPQWPDRFWTMAVGDHSEVVMAKNGIFEYSPNGHKAMIANKPISVGDAVRASSAIPGVFEAIALKGRMLFDGALGKSGKCPTDIASNHLGIPKDRIIASLPQGAMTFSNKALYYAAKFLSGNYEKSEAKIVEEAGLIIRPKVDFGSLKLNLTQAHKEDAILTGYRTTVEELGRSRIVSGSLLDKLREAGTSFETLKDSVKPRNYPVVVYTPLEEAAQPSLPLGARSSS